MNRDLDIIVKRYPRDWNVLRVYAIGDVHVGSPQFDERAVKAKIKRIEEDPYAALVLCGDLADYGLRNSVTDIYKATLSVKEQQEYIYELFLPVVNKLSAAVPGNHESRISKEVGLCPLYDLTVRWDVPEVYRENVAITKYLFGTKTDRQQNVFIGLTTHGSSRNKHKRFIASFHGMDFAVSGHTHTPEYSPHGVIRIDRQHGSARHVPYKEIVVDANLKPGGYGIKHEYEIPPPPELQYLELSIFREPDNVRTERRIIDFHTIQV